MSLNNPVKDSDHCSIWIWLDAVLVDTSNSYDSARIEPVSLCIHSLP